MNSIRTDLIHKEFLDILANRSPNNDLDKTDPKSIRSHSQASSRKTFTTEDTRSSRQSTVKSNRTDRTRRYESYRVIHRITTRSYV